MDENLKKSEVVVQEHQLRGRLKISNFWLFCREVQHD
jgi:hypothetical protein